ncbi:c-type cytochrome [Trinickia sp. LjRoot230]
MAAAAAAVPISLAAVSAAAAQQPDGFVIARSNACLGCHTVDRKLVGPSFRQVAAKYKGDAQALGKLSTKVRDGGSGVWGVIPMPSHPRMTDDDIDKVVKWVLAGAPDK